TYCIKVRRVFNLLLQFGKKLKQDDQPAAEHHTIELTLEGTATHPPDIRNWGRAPSLPGQGQVQNHTTSLRS
ncbi:hypothetical protein, partial [uncultured Dialister sp.]|uniref:hypothetical protein n=1 Tax=uncultured Dialister sp. TaxID=278064 RepID=UPI00265CF4BC